MKQYSKSRQLKVLRYAKKMLIKGSVDGLNCICHAIEEGEDIYYPKSLSYGPLFNPYGLMKYKPRKAGTAFWWPLDDDGIANRIYVLNKRIKELTKKK